MWGGWKEFVAGSWIGLNCGEGEKDNAETQRARRGAEDLWQDAREDAADIVASWGAAVLRPYTEAAADGV